MPKDKMSMPMNKMLYGYTEYLRNRNRCFPVSRLSNLLPTGMSALIAPSPKNWQIRAERYFGETWIAAMTQAAITIETGGFIIF